MDFLTTSKRLRSLKKMLLSMPEASDYVGALVDASEIFEALHHLSEDSLCWRIERNARGFAIGNIRGHDWAESTSLRGALNSAVEARIGNARDPYQGAE